jgi:hypothetical protein
VEVLVMGVGAEAPVTEAAVVAGAVGVDPGPGEVT